MVFCCGLLFLYVIFLMQNGDTVTYFEEVLGDFVNHPTSRWFLFSPRRLILRLAELCGLNNHYDNRCCHAGLSRKNHPLSSFPWCISNFMEYYLHLPFLSKQLKLPILKNWRNKYLHRNLVNCYLVRCHLCFFFFIFRKNNTFACKAKDSVTYQQDLAAFCMLFVVTARDVLRVTRKDNMGTWIKK